MKVLTVLRLVNLTFYYLFTDMSYGRKNPKYSQRWLQNRILFLHVGAQRVSDCSDFFRLQMETVFTYMSVNLSLCLHVSLLVCFTSILCLSQIICPFLFPGSIQFFEHLFQCLLNKTLSSLKHIFPLESMFLCRVQAFSSTHQSES